MRYIKGLLLISLLLCLAGCRTTGYTVRVETDTLEYNEIVKMEEMLIDRGYNMESRAEKRYQDPNDVSTFLEKKFSREQMINGADPKDKKEYFEKTYNEERYWSVLITITYLKDSSNNVVRQFKFGSYNFFIGGISPEIKAEIDKVSDLIYDDLASKVGRENIKVERKEWGPPVVY